MYQTIKFTVQFIRDLPAPEDDDILLLTWQYDLQRWSLIFLNVCDIH